MDRNKLAKQKLKEKNSKKIIIYGAPAHKSTGNSKLIKYMCKAFQSAGHKVYNIGIEYNSLQIWYEDIPIMPGFHCEICGNAHKGTATNVQKIADYINMLRPDFFICVGDPYQYQEFGIGRLGIKDTKTKALMYATIDSEGIFCNEMLTKSGRPDYLDMCDRVISTAKFTQEQFKKWLNLETDLIYECIDLDNYKPVNKERKTELRKKYRFKEKDFIIYYGGRNIMRKRPHILIDACAKFLCETENTYLYLNIPLYEREEEAYYPDSLNPLDFVKRVLKNIYKRDLVAEGRIIFISRGGLGSTQINEEQNAELYQISDVYATTTGGEGFGLMPVESMACGVPVIVPDNSTGAETIGFPSHKATGLNKHFSFAEGGLLTFCPIVQWVDWNLRQRLTTETNTYNAIKFLYERPELKEQLGENGRTHVKKLFNYEDFKNKWLDIIKTTEKKKSDEGFKTLETKETPKTNKKNNGSEKRK